MSQISKEASATNHTKKVRVAAGIAAAGLLVGGAVEITRHNGEDSAVSIQMSANQISQDINGTIEAGKPTILSPLNGTIVEQDKLNNRTITWQAPFILSINNPTHSQKVTPNNSTVRTFGVQETGPDGKVKIVELNFDPEVMQVELTDSSKPYVGLYVEAILSGVNKEGGTPIDQYYAAAVDPNTNNVLLRTDGSPLIPGYGQGMK